MNHDDEVCLCFHVTKRKLQNFLRIEKPRRAAQMSDCFGAGTGCGWCRKYLGKMFEAAQAGKSLGEICRQIKDPARNGGLEMAALLKHMAEQRARFRIVRKLNEELATLF